VNYSRVTVEQIQQTSGPVDRVAARCCRPGESHTPQFAGLRPIPTWDAPPLPEMEQPAGAVDFSGMRRGSLVAFRYLANRVGKGVVWVCRCDCGRYEPRMMRRLTKKLDATDMCAFCQKAFYITHCKVPHDTRSDLQRRLERKAAGCEA
jgi:hypothetical protein